MSPKKIITSAIFIPVLSLMAIPSLTFAAEGLSGKDHPRHRIPFAGELVEITDTTLTISLTAEKDLVQKVLEKRGYVAGDEITFTITEETKIQAKDVEPGTASLSDYESGDTVFIAGGESEDGEMVARLVSDIGPRHKHPHRGGEIISIDVDDNTLVVEKRDNEQVEISYTDDTEFKSKEGEITESDLEEGMRVGIKFEPTEDESARQAAIIFVAPSRDAS
jgi:hypothetical protein